jgi:hypothetical protein
MPENADISLEATLRKTKKTRIRVKIETKNSRRDLISQICFKNWILHVHFNPYDPSVHVFCNNDSGDLSKPAVLHKLDLWSKDHTIGLPSHVLESQHPIQDLTRSDHDTVFK